MSLFTPLVLSLKGWWSALYEQCAFFVLGRCAQRLYDLRSIHCSSAVSVPQGLGLSQSAGLSDRYQPAPVSWLEDASVPASLQITACSSPIASVPPRHLLGKVYRGRLSVLHLEIVGQHSLGLQVRDGLVLVLLHRSGVLEGSCGARPIQTSHQGVLGVLFPKERLELRCTTPVTQLAWLCIPSPLLLLGASIMNKPEPKQHVLQRALHGFELALIPILDAFVREPQNAHQAAAHRQALAQLEVATLSTLLRLLPEEAPVAVPPEDPGLVLGIDRDLCQRADRWIRQHLALDLDLKAIATACNCSKRSLQQAFRSSQDCTPMQHLRRLRLTAMRDQLRLGASVKEACASVGLPPVGRTSSHYFELFGESPSATRSRATSTTD